MVICSGEGIPTNDPRAPVRPGEYIFWKDSDGREHAGRATDGSGSVVRNIAPEHDQDIVVLPAKE